MKPPFTHTAYKVTTTRNEYGDFIAVSSSPLSCHFREIGDVQANNSNEQVQADAMAWFNPHTVALEDILLINGVHYRIEKITEARRLRNPTIQFVKCDLLRYGVIS
jgi:hypothetical protein